MISFSVIVTAHQREQCGEGTNWVVRASRGLVTEPTPLFDAVISTAPSTL
jgi:hypothetical protein